MGGLLTEVIARFVSYKAIAYLIFIFAFLILALVAFPYVAFGTDFLQRRGMLWAPFILVAWLGALVLMLPTFALFRQLVFADRCAVWADEDSIVYLAKRWHSARKDQIASVSLGQKSNRPGIVLRLQDGTEKFIPTGLLSEDPQVIVTRLQQSLST